MASLERGNARKAREKLDRVADLRPVGGSIFVVCVPSGKGLAGGGRRTTQRRSAHLRGWLICGLMCWMGASLGTPGCGFWWATWAAAGVKSLLPCAQADTRTRLNRRFLGGEICVHAPLHLRSETPKHHFQSPRERPVSLSQAQTSLLVILIKAELRRFYLPTVVCLRRSVSLFMSCSSIILRGEKL